METDPIETAIRTLAVRAFCKEQANGLGRCIQAAKGDPSGCQAEVQRMEVCSNEYMPKILRVLMGAASDRCPSEVAAFQQCVRERGSEDACEELDTAALRCGARNFLSEIGAGGPAPGASGGVRTE
eukprot:TRINITY_DN32182_c0_g1_i1.p2 TRINITY_DN32182_c0_g1~~TRINITY_DN32182_c0_g1_i1.p2  ORF type:complete len:126 (+),score=25.68 TRINITY_DN32182_c0_g1_i1:52-429(+)